MHEIGKYLQLLKQHDYKTFLHSRRVASLSILIGKKVKLTEKENEELMITALLHDIGKTLVPERILNKTTTLNRYEILLLKKHSIYGADLISENYSKNIINGVKYHHEFYNGNGYPDKLKGESIPLNARIIAIADAYDAMTNSRPYRKKALRPDEAWGEIQIHSGTQFDPYIVKKIIKL